MVILLFNRLLPSFTSQLDTLTRDLRLAEAPKAVLRARRRRANLNSLPRKKPGGVILGH